MAGAAAVVHVDLDGARHISRVHGWPERGDDDPLFDTGLRNALEFFRATGVRATLFVIAEDVRDPRKLALLREAARQGHEFASHSLTHRRLDRLAPETLRREVAESRALIGEALGVEIHGFRAPAFSVNRRVLECVADAGYRYDSSVFPTRRFAKRTGLSRPARGAYRPLPGRSLLELPMPSPGPLPLPFHPSYSLVLGTWYFRAGLRVTGAAAGPFVVLFHLTDFADPLAGDRTNGWRGRLFTLSHLTAAAKRQRCAEMLDRLRARYSIVTTASWLAHHRAGAGEDGGTAAPPTAASRS